jgi:hypothetical protein
MCIVASESRTLWHWTLSHYGAQLLILAVFKARLFWLLQPMEKRWVFAIIISGFWFVSNNKTHVTKRKLQ